MHIIRTRSRRGLSRRLAQLLTVTSAWSSLTFAQGPQPGPVPIVDPPSTALVVDATLYATHYGVPLKVATSRLRAQAALSSLVDRIRANHGDRLAGIAIEHNPDYRLVVLLAGGPDVAPETVEIAGLPVVVVYHNDAVATGKAIRTSIAKHQAAIRAALTDPPGLGVDERTGALLVTVSAHDAARAGPGTLEGEFTKLTNVPVEIAVLGSEHDLSLAGGERLDATDPVSRRRYTCTSGFAVTDGERTGIATAAHCPDELTADDVPLVLLGAWGAGPQDVQIHGSPVPLAPAFHVGLADVVRPVTGVGTRSRTVVGNFVCHQGFRRGESCAEVVATDFAPPGDLCAGPCPPDWVAVAGPDCERGDSGGPVFDGTIALGIFKGASFRDGRCAIYYYMSIDALPTGWSILSGGEGGGASKPGR